MKQLRTVAMLALTFLVVMSGPAWAVNIQISEGSLRVPHVSDLAIPFDFGGADFRLSGGSTGDLGAFFNFTTFTNGAVGGMADVDGTLHFGCFPACSALTYQGETSFPSGVLNFSTAAVPVHASTDPFRYQATAPFTMTGTVTTYNDRFQTTALDTFNLTGRGTVTANFQGSPDSFWIFGGGIFNFEAPGTGNGGPVIPEPSTVLLLASGLAGLGLWRRLAA